MKDNSPKFITTTFSETADQLQEQGFVLVSHSGNVWTFLNNSKLSFSNIQNLENVAFTNKINL